jgi:phosphoglycolate phosphatase-like HAD superfamily hydrolase
VLKLRPPLFFDLDGPLLDVRRRYHGVYATIAAELGVAPLGLEEYWRAKRRRAPLGVFFPDVHDQASLQSIYMARWLEMIEAPEWLSLDTLVPSAHECLVALRRSHDLYLVTLRRRQDALAGQLKSLELRPHFQEVFSGWAEGAEGIRLKASWIRPLLAGRTGVMLGDSEIDIRAAAMLNMRAIGVSFGIREAPELMALGAESVIGDLGELQTLLEEALVASARSASKPLE